MGNNNSKHLHIVDLASPQETHNLYLTLLTLLFAYAYDARTTQHDPTPESAWTIATLTTAFSALDPPPYFHSPPQPSPQVIKLTNKDDSTHSDFDFESAGLAEAFIPSFRRAIAFSLYRSWALADACRKDVAHFLLRGTRTVLRCLLELRATLDAHEVYYVYSRIWLDDFCRWIQACARYMVLRGGFTTMILTFDIFCLFFREDTLIRLGDVVSHLSISKDSTGWDLVGLEHTVQTTKERQQDSDDEDEDVESERPTLL
jgi:protein SHQ1